MTPVSPTAAELMAHAFSVHPERHFPRIVTLWADMMLQQMSAAALGHFRQSRLAMLQASAHEHPSCGSLQPHRHGLQPQYCCHSTAASAAQMLQAGSISRQQLSCMHLPD